MNKTVLVALLSSSVVFAGGSGGIKPRPQDPAKTQRSYVLPESSTKAKDEYAKAREEAGKTADPSKTDGSKRITGMLSKVLKAVSWPENSPAAKSLKTVLDASIDARVTFVMLEKFVNSKNGSLSREEASGVGHFLKFLENSAKDNGLFERIEAVPIGSRTKPAVETLEVHPIVSMMDDALAEGFSGNAAHIFKDLNDYMASPESGNKSVFQKTEDFLKKRGSSGEEIKGACQRATI